MRLESFISWNIRKNFSKYKIFFSILGLESSISQNIKNLFLGKYKTFFQRGFFNFFLIFQTWAEKWPRYPWSLLFGWWSKRGCEWGLQINETKSWIFSLNLFVDSDDIRCYNLPFGNISLSYSVTKYCNYFSSFLLILGSHQGLKNYPACFFIYILILGLHRVSKILQCILIYLIYFWCVSDFQNHAVHLFLLFLLILDVYPYKYMGSFERFYEDQLLPKEAFYNSLKN